MSSLCRANTAEKLKAEAKALFDLIEKLDWWLDEPNQYAFALNDCVEKAGIMKSQLHDIYGLVNRAYDGYTNPDGSSCADPSAGPLFEIQKVMTLVDATVDYLHTVEVNTAGGQHPIRVSGDSVESLYDIFNDGWLPDGIVEEGLLPSEINCKRPAGDDVEDESPTKYAKPTTDLVPVETDEDWISRMEDDFIEAINTVDETLEDMKRPVPYTGKPQSSKYAKPTTDLVNPSENPANYQDTPMTDAPSSTARPVPYTGSPRSSSCVKPGEKGPNGLYRGSSCWYKPFTPSEQKMMDQCRKTQCSGCPMYSYSKKSYGKKSYSKKYSSKKCSCASTKSSYKKPYSKKSSYSKKKPTYSKKSSYSKKKPTYSKKKPSYKAPSYKATGKKKAVAYKGKS